MCNEVYENLASFDEHDYDYWSNNLDGEQTIGILDGNEG
jgi:hypothetical protein